MSDVWEGKKKGKRKREKWKDGGMEGGREGEVKGWRDGGRDGGMEGGREGGRKVEERNNRGWSEREVRKKGNWSTRLTTAIMKSTKVLHNLTEMQ